MTKFICYFCLKAGADRRRRRRKERKEGRRKFTVLGFCHITKKGKRWFIYFVYTYIENRLRQWKHGDLN